MKKSLERSGDETTFRVYAPNANEVFLNIYEDGETVFRETIPMTPEDDKYYTAKVNSELEGKFYTFLIGEKEICDPLCVSSSYNSLKSAIVDLEKTNPKGFKNHSRPGAAPAVDSVIYELHIKDYTGKESAGVQYIGKYLGLCEEGTSYGSVSTCLDHIIELGVTHVLLMPVYDYITVNELDDEMYGWGYDPELYNVPEGSYSTDPTDPVSRIRELKSLVMALHKKGVKVVLDVVYNHTFKGEGNSLGVLSRDEFLRVDENGNLYNGSGCGSEANTESEVCRRFIIDSLSYWITEYQLDGFRFDLMGLIDIVTMKEISAVLRDINPDVILFGEPWVGGTSGLDVSKQTLKGTQKGNRFAVFNDDFRNAIKGDNDGTENGYVQGNHVTAGDVKKGIVGSICYEDGLCSFTDDPSETINYVGAHDNLILADKIATTVPEGLREKINKFALAVIFTAQGIPFFHAGNEFLRSKQGNHNSYNAPVSINGIDWELKEKNISMFNFTKQLIQLRKVYPHFRLKNADEIRGALKFRDPHDFITNENCDGAITFTIEYGGETILVIHNPHDFDVTLHTEYKCIFDTNGSVDHKMVNNAQSYSTSVYIL